MDLKKGDALYGSIKAKGLYGRYITNTHIEKCFEDLSKPLVSVLGYSVEKRPVYGLTIGKGAVKVLLWSQMHGNESTTTKALFDCLYGFEADNEFFNSILSACTLCVIPILNPDGAQSYARLNANAVDLNRDAQDLSQPESRILRQIYKTFEPNFCFNLHGQRTIYNIANSNSSSIVSFLSPSQNNLRALSHNRKIAMAIISEVNGVLQKEIPNAVGRYDDSFNLNCVGDTFQSFGTPTLLYEAGHYPRDYAREKTRRLIFVAIIKGLKVISNGVDVSNYNSYFEIPENEKYFYDIIIRNVKLNTVSNNLVDIGIQYKECLVNSLVKFIPVVEKISNLSGFYGHKEINAKGNCVNASGCSILKLGDQINSISIDKEVIVLRPL